MAFPPMGTVDGVVPLSRVETVSDQIFKPLISINNQLQELIQTFVFYG